MDCDSQRSKPVDGHGAAISNYQIGASKTIGFVEEETAALIRANRDRIIADLVALLWKRPQAVIASSRWAAWEGDVLARLPQPGEVQRAITDRQQEADAEQEESNIVEDYFRKKLVCLVTMQIAIGSRCRRNSPRDGSIARRTEQIA